MTTTVMERLAADALSINGVLYNGNDANWELANDVYCDSNEGYRPDCCKMRRS